MNRLLIPLCLFALLTAGLAVGCDDAKKAPPVLPTVASKKADTKAKPTGDKAKAGAADAKPKAISEPDGKGGQVVKSELYNVKFTVPKDWKVDKSPTGVSTSSPDSKILMILAGSESQDLAEAALNDLKKNLTFKDVKIDKQGTTTLNGLIGLRGEGSATLINEDKTEEPIHFVAFSSKVDDKAITVLLFAAKAQYDSQMDLVEGILNTMDKL